MNSVRLHRQLVQSLADQISISASQPQRTNLAGLTQALAFGRRIVIWQRWRWGCRLPVNVRT